MIMPAVSIWQLTSHPHNVGTEHAGLRRTRLALDHQVRSAVACPASRVKGELYPDNIVRPQGYWLS